MFFLYLLKNFKKIRFWEIYGHLLVGLVDLNWWKFLSVKFGIRSPGWLKIWIRDPGSAAKN
jgi:hypothetical protein